MYHASQKCIIGVCCLFSIVIAFLAFLGSRSESEAFYVCSVVLLLGAANGIAYILLKKRRETCDLVTDPLTGAFTRAHFEQHLGNEVKRQCKEQRDLALLFVDVDDFASYNLGKASAGGDAALARLVAIACGYLRHDDMVARLSGHQFAILLPESDIESASAVSENFRERVAAESLNTPGDPDGMLTVSIGIAIHRTGESDASLLQRAEHAAQSAKLKGKNQTHRDPGDARGSILVVEDKEHYRKLYCQSLRRSGFLVDCAGTGASTVNFLLDKTYGLLFTCTELPDATGMEVVKAAQAQCPSLQVVVIDEGLSEQDKGSMSAKGPVTFVPRPQRAEEIIDVIIQNLPLTGGASRAPASGI